MGVDLVLLYLVGLVVLVVVNVYVVFFGLSWGLMVWVLLGEMFFNCICVIVLVVVVLV